MFSSFILIPGPFSTGTISYIRGSSETIVPILQPYNGCMHCIQTDNPLDNCLQISGAKTDQRTEDREQYASCCNHQATDIGETMRNLSIRLTEHA